MVITVISFVVFVFVVYLSTKFLARARGNLKLLTSLGLDDTHAKRAGIASMGFIVAAVAAVFPVVLLRLLINPVPFAIVACIPGVMALQRLGNSLERSGTDRVKPVIEWCDSGKLAGWLAIGLCTVMWALAIAPRFLGSSIPS